jgi:hypothetical protein
MVRENTTGGSSIITMHSRRIPFPPQEETETKCAASRRASVVVHGSMRSPRGDQRVFVSAQAHSGSCSPKVVRPGPGQERRDGDCQACGTQLGPVFIFVAIFLFTAGLHGAQLGCCSL